MSISFTVSQAQQIQTLAVWLETGLGDALSTAFLFDQEWRKLGKAYELYRAKRLPLSSVRKQHKIVCDLLINAATRYVELRNF